jgi:flavin reductase (DIM6/NTAB) family NADH-FMN oxidoreductase RutF
MSKQRIEPGPYLVPMPIVLVGALVEGKPNFMTAAFCSIVNTRPPAIACGLSPKHRTCRGIEANGCFSINLPESEQMEITDYCGLNSGDRVDKGKLFRTFTGELAGAPMIEECAVTAECRLLHTHALPVDTVYIAEIVSVYAEDRVLSQEKLDWQKLRPLLFTFPEGAYYRLGDRIDKAWSVGKRYRPA